jgi:succinate dehydrogenase / fumarate reductase, membrane anchor subunit
MSRRASGLKAWIIQRISAVYLALFTLYLLIHFLFAAPADYAAWKGWVARPGVSVAFLLFVPALLAHAWVGVRDVLIDYVRPIGARVFLLAIFAFGLIASGLWALQALFVLRMG